MTTLGPPRPPTLTDDAGNVGAVQTPGGDGGPSLTFEALFDYAERRDAALANRERSERAALRRERAGQIDRGLTNPLGTLGDVGVGVAKGVAGTVGRTVTGTASTLLEANADAVDAVGLRAPRIAAESILRAQRVRAQQTGNVAASVLGGLYDRDHWATLYQQVDDATRPQGPSEAVGSVVGQVGTSLALAFSGALGTPAVVTLGSFSLLAFGQTGGDYIQRARQAGIDPNGLEAVVHGAGAAAAELALEGIQLNALRRIVAGTPLAARASQAIRRAVQQGASRLDPLILRRVGAAALKGDYSRAVRVASAAAQASFTEGVEESIAQVLNNARERYGFFGLAGPVGEPRQAGSTSGTVGGQLFAEAGELLRDAPLAFALGAGAGGIVGGAGRAIRVAEADQRATRETRRREADEAAREALQTLRPVPGVVGEQRGLGPLTQTQQAGAVLPRGDNRGGQPFDEVAGDADAGLSQRSPAAGQTVATGPELPIGSDRGVDGLPVRGRQASDVLLASAGFGRAGEDVEAFAGQAEPQVGVVDGASVVGNAGRVVPVNAVGDAAEALLARGRRREVTGRAVGRRGEAVRVGGVVRHNGPQVADREGAVELFEGYLRGDGYAGGPLREVTPDQAAASLGSQNALFALREALARARTAALDPILTIGDGPLGKIKATRLPGAVVIDARAFREDATGADVLESIAAEEVLHEAELEGELTVRQLAEAVRDLLPREVAAARAQAARDLMDRGRAPVAERLDLEDYANVFSELFPEVRKQLADPRRARRIASQNTNAFQTLVDVFQRALRRLGWLRGPTAAEQRVEALAAEARSGQNGIAKDSRARTFVVARLALEYQRVERALSLRQQPRIAPRDPEAGRVYLDTDGITQLSREEFSRRQDELEANQNANTIQPAPSTVEPSSEPDPTDFDADSLVGSGEARPVAADVIQVDPAVEIPEQQRPSLAEERSANAITQRVTDDFSRVGVRRRAKGEWTQADLIERILDMSRNSGNPDDFGNLTDVVDVEGEAEGYVDPATLTFRDRVPTEIRTALEGLPFPVRAQFRAVKPSSSLYRTARGLDTLSAVGVDRMIELAQSSVRKLDNAVRWLREGKVDPLLVVLHDLRLANRPTGVAKPRREVSEERERRREAIALGVELGDGPPPVPPRLPMMEVVLNPGELPAGSRFTIGRVPFLVFIDPRGDKMARVDIDGDWGGVREAGYDNIDFFAVPEIPLDIYPEMPVDLASLRTESLDWRAELLRRDLEEGIDPVRDAETARRGEAFERAFIREAFDDAPFAIRGNEVRGFENRPVEAILELQRRFTKTGARDTVVRAMVVPGVGPIDFVWGASEREQLVMNGRRHRGHGLMHVWGDHPSQFHAERLVRRLRESGIVMDETAKGQSRRIVLRHGSNSFFVLSEDETVGRMFLLTSFRTNKDVQRAQGPTEPQSFTVGSSASQRVVEGRPGLAGGEIRQPPQSASAARGEADATPAPAPPPRQRARKLVRPPEATPDGFDHAGNPDAARRALDDPGAPPPPPPTDPDAGTAAGPEVEGVPFARRSQNPDDDVERGPQQLVPGVVPRPTTRAGSREPQQFRSRQRVFGEPIGRFRPALDWRAELRRRINERRRAEGRPDLLEPETDVPLYLPENPLFAGFYVAPETRAQLLERKWVDRFNGVKRTQQQVVEQGGVVTDESDAYNEEQLHSGRVGQRLAELDATFMRPLAEEMQALGVSLEQVGEWAWALHAEERNEYLRTQRDPTLRAGSGMTTAQARQILRDAERDNAQALAVARRLLRRLREWVLDVQVEGGLLSEAQRDALKAQYADYVPLRTLDDGTGALQPGQRLGDPPIGVGGREFRRAEGRRSAPFNPVTALFAQASEAVHRAERNKVLMSFAAFFTDNPDPLLWRVERPVQLGDDGQPRWAPLDDQPQDQLLVRFKQNGEPRHIRVNDPTLAAAMRNLRHRELHRVIQWLSIINRTMSGLATRWNPAFLAPNLVRDVQTAAINAGIDVDAEVAVAILRDTPKAVRSVWSALRSPEKASGKFVDRFIEMRAAGGLTGWKSAHDFESTAKRLAAEWNTQHRTVIGQARRLARGVGDLMNDLGDATENGSRLAFYSAMRDRGLSVKQAAAAAKNLTVNFNKRGEYADVANAFLLFFNAGIQGSHRTLQSANTRRGRKLIGAMLAADVLLVGLLRGLAPEDEDGRNAYDYVTPWEKDGNLVGILPDGTRLKLPIPYGYSVIHALANAIVETTAGSETPLGAAARVVGSLSQSFNPTGAVGLKGTIPSQLRPFYELAVNEDYAGRPIYKDAPTFLGYDTPNSTRYFSGVTPASRVVTEWLNEVTGGNEVRSGWIDLNPEIIDHLIRSYGSGLGATLSQSFALPPRVLDAMTGRQVLDVNEVPVFRRFYGQPWPNRFESRFFGDSGELALVEAEARLFLARGEELPERLTPELLRASAAWAGYREAIDEMDLQAAATIDEATPDERRRAAEDRQALLVEALRLYQDAREGREGVMDLLLEQPAGVRGFTAALRRQQRPKDPAER